MISVVYCTREHKPQHLDHIKKMSGHPDVEVIEYINNGISLTKAYNELLAKTKYDITVFIHDDIFIETKQFAKKLTKHFENTEYGILGVAGTKYLDNSGVWWIDRSKLLGKVWHTHNNKKYLSVFGENQDNRVEEAVVVDGVFFSVMKSRLKKNFDEEVKGFHFYDIDFCYRNYLEGVKVGVHTNIVINHLSIGETNQEWDKNKIKFSKKYKETLPSRIDKVFVEKHPFKVLIGCMNFNSFTGSELYNLELAKGLKNEGCDVTICSNIGGEIAVIAKMYGIKLMNIKEPSGYKLKDGVLYKHKDVKFDIMHLSHKPVINHLIKLYPTTPVVSTNHSEIISLEDPVKHNNIKKYIAIRPEIKDYLIDKHNINEDDIEVIFNPIDSNKFNNFEHNKPIELITEFDKNGVVLFVGTIDYLRKNMLIDLINETRNRNCGLWVIGKENGININDLLNNDRHVTYLGVKDNVEDYMRACTETAGILLGRTTIEGWMCGKPGWIYDVDNKGKILNKSFNQVPKDIDKFYTRNVTNKVVNLYKQILK